MIYCGFNSSIEGMSQFFLIDIMLILTDAYCLWIDFYEFS